jgi:hypothetical protein
LMGTLVAPSGICQQQTHDAMGNGDHSCCPAPTSDHSIKTDCCIARATLPAIVNAPTLPGSDSAAVAQEFTASHDMHTPVRFLTAAIIPPKSPPTGASILRV